MHLDCTFFSQSIIYLKIPPPPQAHGYSGEVTLKGVLQMEHLGKHGEYDGMCLSVVVHCSSQQLSQDAKSQWVRVEDEACVQRLRTAVNNKYGCAKLLEL